MVVALDVEASVHRLVAEATVRAYVARGNQVLEVPLLEMVHVSVGADVATIRSVVAVEDRVVELVVDDGPFEALCPAVWALSARGWEVVALTPAHRNGEAHRAFARHALSFAAVVDQRRRSLIRPAGETVTPR